MISNILHGINIYSKDSAVVLKSKDEKTLNVLAEISNLSTIFVDELVSTQDTAYFTTHMPHFWAMNRTNDWIANIGADLNPLKEFTSIVRKFVGSMSTIPIIEEAQRLKYPVYPFVDKWKKKHRLTKYIGIGSGKCSGVIKAASSSRDSTLGFKTQRDKSYTNKAIEEFNLPIAPWVELNDDINIEEAAKKLKFPAVVKPVGLSQGALVHTNIEDINELREKYKSVKRSLKERNSWNKKIIAQTMVKGEDFRILVINNKMRIATKRIPAHVIGNGKSSIESLIEEENKDPARNTDLFTYSLKQIEVDQDLKEVLASQNLDLGSIPNKGQLVLLRQVANMSQGGVTEDVTEQVHPQIRYICETIASNLRIFVAGIDVLTEDISKPLTKTAGSVIEVNSMPEAYLNTLPKYGENRREQYGEWIIDGLIPDNKVTRHIFIGTDPDLEVGGSSKVGLYHNGAIYINGTLISNGLSLRDGFYSLIKNSSLDKIAIHIKDLQEAADHGLLFLRPDYIVTKKELADELTNLFSNKLTNIEITYV